MVRSVPGVAVPGGELVEARHLRCVGKRVDRHLHDGGAAARQRPLHGGGDVLGAFREFAMGAEALGDPVEPHRLAPMGLGFRRLGTESALIDRDLKPPGIVAADDADDGKFLSDRRFKLGDVEQEGGVAGDENDAARVASMAKRAG